MPVKPSEMEEEYFARLELERKKKAEVEKQRRLAAEEKARLKELHHMHCPKCGMNLTEIQYQNIKVDKCFQCNGVWLDAAELEAISIFEKGGMDKVFSFFKK